MYDYRFHKVFILGGMVCEDTNRIVSLWFYFAIDMDRDGIFEVL